jgi:hypothetical protein
MLTSDIHKSEWCLNSPVLSWTSSMLPRDPEFSSRLDFADTLALQSLPLSADPLHEAFPPDAAVQQFLCCPAGQLLLARRADAIRDQADIDSLQCAVGHYVPNLATGVPITDI